MAGAHSFLPPSGAAAWQVCAMWPHMVAAYPQDDTPEAMEGAAAHWVVEKFLAGQGVTLGTYAPNGIMVTQEMLDGAELYCDAVDARLPDGCVRHVEERVQIRRVHPDCHGTPDLWGVTANSLEIVDYKFGHGFVDEFENWQLIAYAAGILDELVTRYPHTMSIVDFKVSITVVQPRCYHKGAPVRTWSTSGPALRPYIDRLHDAALRVMSVQPEAVTNRECRHCPGRHACQALQRAAYSDAEYASTSAPLELTPEAASLELRMLERAGERLQARIDGMREAVLVHLKQGQRVAYHRIEQTPGRAQWNVPVEEVIAMGHLMGVNLAKAAVLTPGQARKAGIDESVISAYSTVQGGQLTLVADNPADARRVFGNFSEK